MPTAYEAELLEGRLVVWDPKQGSDLYKLGFYGKPVGITKPKTCEFNVPLTLDLIEGLYLAEKGLLSVYRGAAREPVSIGELGERGKRWHEAFDLKYAVYKDLRERGFIVTPGIKFGCDFAVYEKGPGIDHAPFLVSLKTRYGRITALEIVRAGRLATTVKKRFVIAVPDPKTQKIRYLAFRWWKP